MSLQLTRRRRIRFALAAMAIAATTSMAMLIAVDVYLHGRFQRSAGFNIWGYRGPVAPRKQPGEYRVVMLGGSATYGYGATWEQSIPAVMEQNLRGHTVGPFRRFSVINLGYNNEGAYSFKYTLADYRSLRYDLAILYEGYNDLMADPTRPNLSVFRHDSPVFRLTGYLPIFPIVFKEKAAAMMTGSTAGFYQFAPKNKTVFRPDLATKTAAEVLRGAGEIGESLERQLQRVSAEPLKRIDDPASTGCKSPWEAYCRSMAVAVEFALNHGYQVLVATQPYGAGQYFRQRHGEQQSEMVAMLERTFPGNPRLRYVNFGDVVDLMDRKVSFDRMHLTALGNQRIAAAFVQPVLEMAVLREQHDQ